MSYGHVDNLNQPEPQRRDADTPPEQLVDPALFDRDDLRTALTARDIAALYQVLTKAGISQARIARATGQSPSEVSEIIAGRKVQNYDVLVRIAQGLHVPREYMGLSYGATSSDDGYRGVVTVTDTQEGVDEMLRRHFEHLLALGAAAAVGAPIPKVGKLDTALPVPGLPVDLPTRIGVGDVAVIRGYTENLRTLGRTHGGQGRAAVALTGWADRWLDADASAPARRGLLAALSDLHTITGWCCHDSRAAQRSHYHFGRAVELATDAGDGCRAGCALYHAGMMLIHRGQPDQALKLAQLAEHRLTSVARDHPEIPVLVPWLHAVAASALASLGHHDQARSQLAQARDGWQPSTRHGRADMDLSTALTWLHLGQLDASQEAAALAVQTFAQGPDRRDGIEAHITQARTHLLAGEPTGLRLAADAINAVEPLHSQLARELWLPLLAQALDTRPGSDARDLARQARQVATTRV